MIVIIQMIAAFIPIIGIAVLLVKPKTEISVKLLMTNIGCFILDAGYFSQLSSRGEANALLFLRIQYIGNVVFYSFFALFVLSFLGIKVHHWAAFLWFLIEGVCASIYCGWGSSDRSEWMIKDFSAEIVDEKIGNFSNEEIYQVVAEQGTLLIIRNGILCSFLFFLLVLTLCKMFKLKEGRVRNNMGVLAGAEAIVITTMSLNIFCPQFKHYTPICASSVLLVIVIRLISGEFITVADQAREWTFEHMDNIVVITDGDLGFLDCNERAAALFPVLKRYPKNAPVPDIVRECMLRNGEDFPIDDKVVRITVKDLLNKKNANVDGYCLLLQDVTEDRRVCEQLETEKQNADQANAAKSTFLSNMSHEIRTPMNAIVGMTEILMREPHSKEDMEYLSSIKSSGQALLAIINDVLDYSKAESGKMSLVEMPYDIHGMLKDLKLMLLTRSLNKPIELLFDIDEKLPRYVFGDSLRIRQVIINIVNNAIKFTSEGYVKLIVRVDEIKDGIASIYFCVKDTGTGIKEEDLEKLFKSFSQVDTKRNRNVEGTGLGLAISKQLVELMGGNIGVSSVYGKGSEFYFTINQRICTKEESAEVANLNIDGDEAHPSEEFTAKDARILIVDDNPMNLKVAVGLFAPIEMKIDTADSAAAAFELIEKNSYDIVFMDHMMPVMDGVEATLELRKSGDPKKNRLVIIALTANALQEAREEFARAGMNDFIAKPINMNEVRDKLVKWLPEEKIIYKKKRREKMNPEEEKPEQSHQETQKESKLAGMEIEGIDLKAGVENSGTEELLLDLLSDFRKLIDVKSGKMEKCLEDGLIKDYTIEVHALKSTARMIGALELSEQAKEMEALGNKEDVEALREKNPAVMALYRSYKERLFAFASQSGTNEITRERFTAVLDMMEHAADSFDCDTMDGVMKELEDSALQPEFAPLMDRLRVCVADLATEEIPEIINEMRTIQWNSRT